MTSFLSVHLCVLVFYAASIAAEPSVKEPKRSKLTSVYALTPSLRVGRRSEGAWDPTLEMKRRIGKIAALPRVGRSEWTLDDDSYTSKRTGSNTGMWFGPRLGRLQKRDAADNLYPPWTYIILNGEGPVSRQVHYTPRLGRESEELLDDSDGDVLMA